MRSLNSIILFLLCITIMACSKPNDLPVTPEIKYYSHEVKQGFDSLGNKLKLIDVKFSFKDREGDIGLSQNEIEAPYDFNLQTTSYIQLNGNFEFRSEEKSRISDLRTYATKRGLQGYINIELKEYVLIPNSTFKYEIFILDRELHKSNVISTPEITFN